MNGLIEIAIDRHGCTEKRRDSVVDRWQSTLDIVIRHKFRFNRV